MIKQNVQIFQAWQQKSNDEHWAQVFPLNVAFFDMNDYIRINEIAKFHVKNMYFYLKLKFTGKSYC